MQPRVRRLLGPLAIAAVLLGPAGNAGCESECRKFEQRCVGNQLWVCEGSEVQHFVNQGACSDHCVTLPADAEGKANAVCSKTGSPDPRCETPSGSFCVDARTMIRCAHGHSVEAPRCPVACVDAREYVGSEQRGAAFCSLSATPDAACAATIGLTCDGSDVVGCHRGYVIERIACGGASPRCAREHVSGFSRPYCVTDRPCAERDQTQCNAASRMTGCVAGRVVDWLCPNECRQYATTSFLPSSECR